MKKTKNFSDEVISTHRKKVVADVVGDFERRREERKSLERSWRLNMQFISGNQYCDVSPSGELCKEYERYFWQSQKAYNHIAPTLDSRLSGLMRIRPTLRVRAASDSEDDLKTARLCSSILDVVKSRLDFDGIISEATLWSESCGTSFYKVIWNSQDGNVIGTDVEGHTIHEGDVNVVALSPFEVYPDSITAEKMSDVKSIIHAKAVPVSEVKERFGVEVVGEDISDFTFQPYSEMSGRYEGGVDRTKSGTLKNAVVLIERYTRPTGACPNGRLEIVAGGKLLYEGELPYLNGDRGERTLPFIRQTCIALAGSFFGSCVVDRMIPLQRAYNAVRNRKQEFLNRLTMGVMTVEDGSVDTDELSDDGLYPGKVIVYRQGSQTPSFLDCGNLSSDFSEEEERILNEFVLVSGISEVSRNSANPTHVTSAVGLQLLLDQDTNRMKMTSESIERAIKEAGKQILHLYRQFASTKRVLRMTGVGGGTELHYFSASDISADDIQFETEYDKTESQKKQEIMTLLSLGLLKDGDGNLSDDMRNRVLEALGFGTFENARDISALHVKKAESENLALAQGDVEADEYDDHALHIVEHTRALLSGAENNGETKERIVRHIANHRRMQGE